MGFSSAKTSFYAMVFKQAVLGAQTIFLSETKNRTKVYIDIFRFRTYLGQLEFFTTTTDHSVPENSETENSAGLRRRKFGEYERWNTLAVPHRLREGSYLKQLKSTFLS